MTAPPDDFRQALHRLEILEARLRHHQDAYFICHKEFWESLTRLARLLPQPQEPDDEATRFHRDSLNRLISFSADGRVTRFLQNALDLNSDRAGLALSLAAGLFGHRLT